MLTYYRHQLRNISTSLHLLYSSRPAKIQVSFVFWFVYSMSLFSMLCSQMVGQCVITFLKSAQSTGVGMKLESPGSFSTAVQGSIMTSSLLNGAILSAWAHHLIWTLTLHRMRKEVLIYPRTSPWKEFEVISPIMKSQPWNSYSGRTIDGKIPITARIFFLLITMKNLLHIITFWMRASMQ